MLSLPSPSPAAPQGRSAAASLLLRGARLADGGVADVLVTDGKITTVGTGPAGHPAPADVLDLRGYLLLPSLAEPHAHLDKAFTAAAVANPDGSLRGAIDAWLAARPGLPTAGIASRAWAAATRYLAHGTTAIRAHVDVGEDVGLRGIDALLDVRAGLAGIVDIEIVALTSIPVTGRAGAANRALLREALAAGADLAGGAPALDDDPGRAVEVLAAAAADAGAGLDLHIDETTDAAVFTLPRLVSVADAGFGHPITASHVVSLGAQVPEHQRAVARSLARAGISVVTLPQTNLFLQGRGLGAAAPRGLTAVRELLDAGVRVAAGGDNLQDPFNPMGRADPLETASLLVVAAHLTPAEAFTAVAAAGRHIMRLPEVTIAPGAPADLVAVRAEDLGSAVASGTPDRVVLRGGRVVARTRVDVELAVAGIPARTPTWRLLRARRAS